MPDWCVDTSGLSNPYGAMPEDIHETLWRHIRERLGNGHIAVTKEIFDEMVHIDGGLGDHIAGLKGVLLFEVNDDKWNWKDYIDNVTRMQVVYRQFISEFNLNRKDTVGLNDISIVGLAKTLNRPLVSMEKKTLMVSPVKRRIPDICELEGIEHCTFSEFPRREGIKV